MLEQMKRAAYTCAWRARRITPWLRRLCAASVCWSTFVHPESGGDLQTSKNLPYIFDTCTERLGTDKRTTAVFEDSLHCVVTASGAGYPVVGVYDDSAKTETEEICRLSRCFVYSWKELDIAYLEQSL